MDVFATQHAIRAAEIAVSAGRALKLLDYSRGTAVAWSGPHVEPTMVRLTERRRVVLAEKFGDLANYAVAGLVFGQAVGQDDFSFSAWVAGVAIWLLFMGATFFLVGDSQ